MSRFAVRPVVVLGLSSLAVWGAQSCLAPGSLDHEELFRIRADASADAGQTRGQAGPGCVAACTTFRTTCSTSGCHTTADPATGLDLQSPGVVARLTGAPAQSGACANQTLLVPGNITKSLVYTKLLQKPACGIRMPEVGMLSADDIDCVRRWVLSPSCPDEMPDASAGSGGMTGSGGMNDTGGMTGSGGTNNAGGMMGAGGASGNGGMKATGGANGTGGKMGTGGMNNTGGATMDAGKPSPPIYVEAESGSLTAPMVVSMDGAASGGEYISAPGAARNDDPTMSTMGIATFMFDIATGGIYTVYGRVEAQSMNTDSFWVKMDDGAWIQWNNISNSMSTTWTWETVHDSNNADAVVPFTLKAGNHTLLIANREPDAWLDKLSISNDPAYMPTGTGQ